jgi:hypothetical protein
MQLKLLLTLHALITLAAAIVLVVQPEFIPGSVGIKIDRASYLICYLLAAFELSLSMLSFFSRNLTDPVALKAILISIITLHVASAILEVYALTQGTSASVLFNVVARIVISLLFYYYGIYLLRERAIQ